MSNAETTLCKQIRIAVCRTRRARVVRCNTGFIMTEGRAVSFGLGKGTPDLVGCLRTGRVFCLEIKTERGRLSPDQEAWHRACRAWGGFVAEVRSVDEALAALARAEEGRSA